MANQAKTDEKQAKTTNFESIMQEEAKRTKRQVEEEKKAQERRAAQNS